MDKESFGKATTDTRALRLFLDELRQLCYTTDMITTISVRQLEDIYVFRNYVLRQDRHPVRK